MKKLTKFITVAGSTVCIAHNINKLILNCNINKNLIETKYCFYKSTFGNVHYKKQGNGKPILLIHSLIPGASYKEFSKILDSLSENYTVYAIDLIGFGNSDKPPITYSSYLYVSLINEFIENVIKEKTNIIASNGFANMTIIASLFNKNNFEKFIFISPDNYINYHKNKLLSLLIEIPIIGTSIYNILISKKVIYNFLKKYGYVNYNNIDKKYIDEYNMYSHIKNFNSKYILSSILKKEFDLDIKNNIKNIDITTTIICNDNYEFNYIRNLNNPNIKLEIISNTKLFPQNEKPLEFINICKNFI